MGRHRPREMVCCKTSDICPLSMKDVESGVHMSATGLPVMMKNIIIMHKDTLKVL